MYVSLFVLYEKWINRRWGCEVDQQKMGMWSGSTGDEDVKWINRRSGCEVDQQEMRMWSWSTGDGYVKWINRRWVCEVDQQEMRMWSGSTGDEDVKWINRRSTLGFLWLSQCTSAPFEDTSHTYSHSASAPTSKSFTHITCFNGCESILRCRSCGTELFQMDHWCH
jgi:hypothetical protein